MATAVSKRLEHDDHLIVVPAGQQPQKSSHILPSSQRWNLCQLTFAGVPSVQLSPIEMDRQTASYMMDTVVAMSQRFPRHRLMLVLGADSLQNMSTWHRAKEWQQRVSLLVVDRDGVRACGNSRTEVLAMEPVPVSSTQVREALGRRFAERQDALSLMMVREAARYLCEWLN